MALKRAYSIMPMPVRLLLSEEKFVKFGMGRKASFLGASGTEKASVVDVSDIQSNDATTTSKLTSVIPRGVLSARKNHGLYDLNFSTLKAKIAKLESSTEKARVDMIIESMLNSVEEITVANSRATADAMRGALV